MHLLVYGLYTNVATTVGDFIPTRMTTLFVENFFKKIAKPEDFSDTAMLIDECLKNGTLAIEVTRDVYETAKRVCCDEEAVKLLCAEPCGQLYSVTSISKDSMLVPATCPFVLLAGEAARRSETRFYACLTWDDESFVDSYHGAVQKDDQLVEGTELIHGWVYHTALHTSLEDRNNVPYQITRHKGTSYLCVFFVRGGVVTMRIDLKDKHIFPR